MPVNHIIREIPPEQCEFSYYFDDDGIREAGGDFCYNLFVVSFDRWNRVEGFQADIYKDITKEIDEIGEYFQDVKDGYKEFFRSYRAIMEYFHIDYSPRKCHALKEFFENMEDSMDPETVAAYLTITTGRPWNVDSARGYCQGDYVEIVYCSDFHKNPRAYGEIYLGAGKEFCVIDLDENGEESDTVYGYIVADCEAWTDEEYKRLVCEWAGIQEEETQLEMIE